jgi:RHS repeat-associated protein
MNNILNETRSNGIVSEYVYNANREYIEIKHLKDNDIFVHLRYTRDAIGNIITESGTSPLEIPFTDTALNCTYNIADQVEICGNERYEYDNDGNLTVIGSGRWQAVYNAENQLTELTYNGKKIVYTYNGLNQRIGISNGQYSRRFYYDTAGRLLFETDNNGNIKAINIYAGGFLTARINEVGETHFYHFDKTGSTIALTDNNGQVTAAYAYSSFGAVVNRAGQTEDNPFTYVGQFGVVDEGEGLFFMKYRFYDAVTGRFVQKDPIGFDGGINQYAYVDNNPVKGIDPEGTACLPALLIFGAFVAAGWYLKCQFQGNAPWDKALNLHNVKSPTQRQEQASQISQEGKPYMRDMVMSTGDKALSINPVTGPGYSAIKAAHAAGEGDAVGVLRNAPCAPANNIGSAATVANESYDAYNAHKNAK